MSGPGGTSMGVNIGRLAGSADEAYTLRRASLPPCRVVVPRSTAERFGPAPLSDTGDPHASRSAVSTSEAA